MRVFALCRGRALHPPRTAGLGEGEQVKKGTLRAYVRAKAGDEAHISAWQPPPGGRRAWEKVKGREGTLRAYMRAKTGDAAHISARQAHARESAGLGEGE